MGQFRTLFVLGVVFWILSLAVGFHILSREQYTPIAGSCPAPGFPASSALSLDARKPLLLFFAHPHCPCTRAGLRELGRLAAEIGNKASICIVFTLPEGVPPDWEKGDLLGHASRIPNARIFLDQGGSESRRFAVQGSGETLLYSPAGSLLFHGGITPSRGHEGESPGKSAIADFVLRGGSTIRQSPAFGCSLL